MKYGEPPVSVEHEKHRALHSMRSSRRNGAQPRLLGAPAACLACTCRPGRSRTFTGTFTGRCETVIHGRAGQHGANFATPPCSRPAVALPASVGPRARVDRAKQGVLWVFRVLLSCSRRGAADDDAAHPSTSSLRPAAGIAWGRAVLYRRMLPIDPSISRCHNLLCDRGFLWAMR